MEKPRGATIERGEIQTASADGYTVKSLDRNGIDGDGIVSPKIKSADGTAYAKGDRVYFFLFADGTGLIMYRMT